MRWTLGLGVFLALSGCMDPGSGPQTLRMEYVKAAPEGSAATDPVWVTVRVSHERDEPLTLEVTDFALHDSGTRTYEFFAGYAVVGDDADAPREPLPFVASPGATYEVHLEGYLVGAPPEPPLTVRWSEGVERATTSFAWPPV